MAQAATKKKTQVKDRLKSGEYRLLRIKNPPAFIGLAHNVALKANDEADCVQYVPFRKCSKCWMIYAKATSSNVIKKHHTNRHSTNAQSQTNAASQNQNTMNVYTVPVPNSIKWTREQKQLKQEYKTGPLTAFPVPLHFTFDLGQNKHKCEELVGVTAHHLPANGVETVDHYLGCGAFGRMLTEAREEEAVSEDDEDVDPNFNWSEFDDVDSDDGNSDVDYVSENSDDGSGDDEEEDEEEEEDMRRTAANLKKILEYIFRQFGLDIFWDTEDVP